MAPLSLSIATASVINLDNLSTLTFNISIIVDTSKNLTDFNSSNYYKANISTLTVLNFDFN